MRAPAALVVLVAWMIASSAAAQTTDCDRTFTGYSCSTSPNPAAGFAALAGAIQARRRKQEIIKMIEADMQAGRCDEAHALTVQYGNASDVSIVDSRCVPAAVVAQQAENTLMASISTAVREGRCDDAKQTALAANRLDLADQALRICTPPTP